MVASSVIEDTANVIDAYYKGTSHKVPLFDALLMRVGHRLFPPLSSMELIVTEKCPLACGYCWVKKNQKSMTKEMAERAVDFFVRESRGEKTCQYCCLAVSQCKNLM